MSGKEILPDGVTPPEQPSKGEALVVRTEDLKVPKEVESWLEKLERGEDAAGPTVAVQDPQTGQPLLYSPQAKVAKIVLPVTKQEFVVFLKEGVEEAARWLAEFCYRLIKMGPRKVVFKT